MMINRQERIELHKEGFNPMLIFVEGTTNNGSCLMSFKRGAFEAMRTVIPTVWTFSHGQIAPFYESVQVLPLMALLFSSLEFCVSTNFIMPDFTPTAKMLDLHADKGTEPWEKFAWCVRDACSKVSGLPVDDTSTFRKKRQYADFMQGKFNEIEIDGKTYRYPPDSEKKNA